MTTKPKTPAPKQQAGPEKPAKAAIYALCDPRTGEARYIGKANSPDSRLRSHIRDARRRSTPVYCWINKLLREGVSPSMVVLSWTGDWRSEEKLLIAKQRHIATAFASRTGAPV